MGYNEEKYQDERNADWSPSQEKGMIGLVKTSLGSTKPVPRAATDVLASFFGSRSGQSGGENSSAAQPVWLMKLAEKPAVTGIRDGADDYYQRLNAGTTQPSEYAATAKRKDGGGLAGNWAVPDNPLAVPADMSRTSRITSNGVNSDRIDPQTLTPSDQLTGFIANYESFCA